MKSDTAINIGSNKQLYVDNFLIARSHGLESRFHLPIPEKIVMLYDKPWEGSGSDF